MKHPRVNLAVKITAKQSQVAVPAPTTPAPAPVTPPVQQVQPTPVQPTTHEELMAAAGISPADYGAADYIISHESSWSLYAQEPTTGAYGLCQSLPGYKMAAAGSDWATNAITQLKWCNSYAISRYGGWWASYDHWVANRNW